MPNVKKLIEKMKQQPNGIRPEEIDKVFDNNKTRKSIKKSLCCGCAK